MSADAIMKALAGYFQAIDDGRTADAANFFTDEALILVPNSPPATGRNACRSLFDALHNPQNRSMHCMVNNFVEIDGETAGGSFDLFTIHRSSAPPTIAGALRCSARYAVERNEWKIARLDFGAGDR